jgi:membrane-associated phospholipid phosphatase
MDISFLGIYGPVIMMILSILILWTKKTFLNYTLIGITFSILLNVILKIIFKCQRPGMSNHEYIIVKRECLLYWIENDPFGFPSGHSQSAAYITAMIYNAFGMKPITLLFALYTVFIMRQRVVSKKHTIPQVIAGGITGVAIAVGVYHAYKHNLAGYIIHKLDDWSRIF